MPSSPDTEPTTTLGAQLAAFQQQFRERAGAATVDLYAAEQQRVDALVASRRVARVGEVVEPFVLPSATGDKVSLEALLSDGPAVLVFYRGAWCPYCNLTLRAYQAELLPGLAERGVAMVALSPERPDAALSVAEKHELAFPVLSDVGLSVAEALGLVVDVGEEVHQGWVRNGLVDLAAHNADGRVVLPIPTVVLLDRDRRIHFIDAHPDYTTRTEPAAVLAAVDALGAR